MVFRNIEDRRKAFSLTSYFIGSAGFRLSVFDEFAIAWVFYRVEYFRNAILRGVLILARHTDAAAGGIVVVIDGALSIAYQINTPRVPIK